MIFFIFKANQQQISFNKIPISISNNQITTSIKIPTFNKVTHRASNFAFFNESFNLAEVMNNDHQFFDQNQIDPIFQVSLSIVSLKVSNYMFIGADDVMEQ